MLTKISAILLDVISDSSSVRPLHHSWAVSTSPFPVLFVHISLGVIPSSDKAAKNGEEFFFKKTFTSLRTPIYACPVSPPIGCKFHPDSLSISILSDPFSNDFIDIYCVYFCLISFSTSYFKSIIKYSQYTDFYIYFCYFFLISFSITYFKSLPKTRQETECSI